MRSGATPVTLTRRPVLQQAEPDHTFHGEFVDAMDDASVAFELEDARRVVVASEKGAQGDRERFRQGAHAHDLDNLEEARQRKKLTIHPTCASAYALLLQRRCSSLREVSLAWASHVHAALCRPA